MAAARTILADEDRGNAHRGTCVLLSPRGAGVPDAGAKALAAWRPGPRAVRLGESAEPGSRLPLQQLKVDEGRKI